MLPLSYCRALCRIAFRKPTKKELASYVPEELTNPMEWKPTLEYDSDTLLENNLASFNTLLPVPTGEGVLLLKTKKKHKKNKKKPLFPSQKARHNNFVARKQPTRLHKSSKMSRKNLLIWNMSANALVGNLLKYVRKHSKLPHNMPRTIFVCPCMSTTKHNFQLLIASV